MDLGEDDLVCVYSSKMRLHGRVSTALTAPEVVAFLLDTEGKMSEACCPSTEV